MGSIIATQDLWRIYGRFAALRGLDLAVPERSIFALLGANGAGKTTVIKTLLNIIAPTRGSASVLGVDSRAMDPARLAKIGYVSENQAFPGRLRVDDFFAYLRKMYPTWDRDTENDLRRTLGLPPDRRIAALSHGMRLKMALACALSFRPALLILDEPFSGLDALVREEITAGFLKHAGEMTIFISSHELDEIERLATHVGVIDGGRLLFQGTLAELHEHARPLLDGGGRRDPDRISLRDLFVAMTRTARAAGAAAGSRLP